ncbi:MAG: hypothetical protein K0Q72_4302 [Armatimonadetes bacterium]|nr:hypothetical protein [Armatimonadota bacterium]
MSKLRVLYIVQEFPQISETYIKSEIEAIQDECEVLVISMFDADVAYADHAPFHCLQDPAQIRRVMEEFRPDVLHSHWLHHARLLGYLSGALPRPGERVDRYIPFTIRAHSFDVLGEKGRYIRDAAPVINSELCLGVFAFPFSRAPFEQAGIHPEKIQDCFPVVHYRRFLDRSPNGPAVMNMGACLPKKKMSDFLELAAMSPRRQFNLYAMGYRVAEMERLNEQLGSPVTIVPPLEPDVMPAEYKRHEWLVYTGCEKLRTVGWPIAVAEAQASGVGVCMPNLRPDLGQYVGKAGFLFESIAEVAEIISRPFPSDLREEGFEHARKSDVFEHGKRLIGLWQSAGTSPATVEPAGTAAPAWGQGGSTWEWQYHLHAAQRELQELMPAGGDFILVDDDQWRAAFTNGRRPIPFVERDGQYWGPPADDAAAIQEVQRSREAGVGYLVVGRPAFWWLDQYSGLRDYLRANFPCPVENEHLVVFNLRKEQS